jgi:hypothetical protein
MTRLAPLLLVLAACNSGPAATDNTDNTGTSTSSTTTTGCRLMDLGVNMDDLEIDPGGPLVLAPGARVVMARTADPAANGGVAGVVFAFGDLYSLTNTGDAFILRCGDVDVDTVEFAPTTWPYGVGVGMQQGPAMTSAVANDEAAAWCAAASEYIAMNTGSPGADNPPCP